MYMFDTNAFSALMKQHPKFQQRFDNEALKNMCISSLAWAEVRYGVRKNNSAKWLQISDKLVQGIRVMPFNQQVAETYAVLRADIEKQGKNLSPIDMLIAACAVANDCVLVTNDQAFLQIEQLQVEDWTV